MLKLDLVTSALVTITNAADRRPVHDFSLTPLQFAKWQAKPEEMDADMAFIMTALEEQFGEDMKATLRFSNSDGLVEIGQMRRGGTGKWQYKALGRLRWAAGS